MHNLGNLIGLLITIVGIGLGSQALLKVAEAETAKMAVEAHQRGYVSIRAFHEKLTSPASEGQKHLSAEQKPTLPKERLSP